MTIRKRVDLILKKLNINKAPIPLEEIAGLFSLNIVYYPNFPEHISGMIIKEDNLLAIGVNSNKPETRQRFTIAHEIGHYVMGHDEDTILEDFFDKKTDKEVEANKFASELLMPYEILKKDISNTPMDIPKLASLYHVSEQAMSVRLLESKLINLLTSK
jgi:Zn-dependent peptidase ImmA (M78 family)